jgi:hypothetical protein
MGVTVTAAESMVSYRGHQDGDPWRVRYRTSPGRWCSDDLGAQVVMEL